MKFDLEPAPNRLRLSVFFEADSKAKRLGLWQCADEGRRDWQFLNS
jgi:hypothetical protein